MSEQQPAPDHQPTLLRPRPRNFNLTPLSTPSTTGFPSPNLNSTADMASGSASNGATASDTNTSATSSKRPSFLNLRMTSAQDAGEAEEAEPPSRSRSILNLTSSTLLGIYGAQQSPDRRQSQSSLLMDSNEAMRTPRGTGAQTPGYESHREVAFPGPTKPAYSGNHPITVEGVAAKLEQNRSPAKRSVAQTSALELLLGSLIRVLILAGIGVAYGAFITHLHDTQKLAPVKVRIERRNARYLSFWGGLAVLLGAALPYVDGLFRRESSTSPRGTTGVKGQNRHDRNALMALGAEWNPIVRSVGAFVGIAFAIRKLPWQSPQQLSLTLALVNPCIWYLVDRTRTGFWISMTWALLGSGLLLSLVPGIIPQPQRSAPAGRNFSSILHSNLSFDASSGADLALGPFGGLEGVGVAAWTGSVLFCSSVFFGNVGRRLWGDTFA